MPLPASPTLVPPPHSPTSSRCFFLMLHWRRREGKKEFNNVQLWRLRKGTGGVLGLRIKFIDVWSPVQHRPELQPLAHIQEELTLLAPCGKSPPPLAYSLSLPPSLPPAHPDVIKEFSSCLFALGCSCSPRFTPDPVRAHTQACATLLSPTGSGPAVQMCISLGLLLSWVCICWVCVSV